MVIRFGRTLPPAAAPIPLGDILRALPSFIRADEKEVFFETEIKVEFKQRYCMLVSSGKAALFLILQSLRDLYPERDEVIIPAFTCYSVPAAIKKAGLKIALCDTGVASLDYDKIQLQEIIETDRKRKKILCVLVTHLFGYPANIAEIKELVGNRVIIVEDAAQAMGGEINNKKIGTLGDIGFFSLGRGKALSTIEGGLIVTNREDLGKSLTSLRKGLKLCPFFDRISLATKAILVTLLQRPLLFWIPKALPFLGLGETIYDENFNIYRMCPLQQNLARNWKKRLKLHQKERKSNIEFWQKYLPKELSFIGSIPKKPSLIRLPVMATSAIERDRIYLESEKGGCGVMPTYPATINEIPEISKEFAGKHYPNAKKIVECLLTLPVHEYVKERDRILIRKLLKVRNGNE